MNTDSDEPIEVQFIEIWFNDGQHITKDHVNAEIVGSAKLLVLRHTRPDGNGNIWSEAYPLNSIDWFRWRDENND